MRVLIEDRPMWLAKVDQLIGYYTAERDDAVREFFEERRHGALSWLREQIGRPTRPRTDEEILAQMHMGEKLDLHAREMTNYGTLATLKMVRQALLTEGTSEVWLEAKDLQALQ